MVIKPFMSFSPFVRNVKISRSENQGQPLERFGKSLEIFAQAFKALTKPFKRFEKSLGTRLLPVNFYPFNG